MSDLWIIPAAIATWIIFIVFIRATLVPWLANAPTRDPVAGVMWRVVRVYARLLHRVRYNGLPELRNQVDSGPLLVVSNHTGSVDPLLIQAGCRFHIRWLMASEMIVPWLDFVWRRQQPIPVDRDGRDTTAAREAIRTLESGRAVGIFPEGRIVQPPRQIRPFHAGVGLIVARARVPVLLVWISGTPDTNELYRSLTSPSRARVEYLELIDFKGERDPHVIAEHLRQRLSQASGWPINNQSQPRSAERPVTQLST